MNKNRGNKRPRPEQTPAEIEAIPGEEPEQPHLEGEPAELEEANDARDPAKSRNTDKKANQVPTEDEQQMFENAAEEGVERADDDQRFFGSREE
ncbi:MAG TPA: hypothetical protein VJ960_01070 [Oceanipulchritudo sp.]|nr:hypothetical protein [Oceanipulchritudo sp.]